MERSTFHYNQLISELVRSSHGDLHSYKNIVFQACESDPEFLAHLITWNLVKGEIRDSKIAIPVLSLRKFTDDEYITSSIASLLSLDPRNLVKAYHFNKELSKKGENIISGGRRVLEFGLKLYLRIREENPGWWTRAVLQHKKSMKELYAVAHYKPSTLAQRVLFDNDYPRGSVFRDLKKLKEVSIKEAAGIILTKDIPFQIAIGALGLKKKDIADNSELALAFLEKMSGQQLLNSTKFLSTLGVFTKPHLKTEYDKALNRAKLDKKVSTLKAGKVIDSLPDIDESIKKRLEKLQEVKIEQTGGIEGDWLICGDCSGSMSASIEIAKEAASLITKSVKGKVYLIFFDSSPRYFDVSGKTLEEIKSLTKGVRSGGRTSIGCGLTYLEDRSIVVNGIVIVSDGGDNTSPLFHDAYKKYSGKMQVEPTVYLLKVHGDYDRLTANCNLSNIMLDTFTMDGKADYYSLPNIIKSLKVKRYQLLDEILATPLLTFDTIFSKGGKK